MPPLSNGLALVTPLIRRPNRLIRLLGRHGAGERLGSRAPLALLALGTLASACGTADGSTGGRGGDTAYVGVAVGLANPARYADLFVGVELAFEQLNAKRAAGTPPLALRRAPDTATTDVLVATAFRDDAKVVAVVGHTESNATIAAAPVYADREHDGRNPLVAVTPATARHVTRVSPWIFRVNATVVEQGQALARFVADSLGHRRAGLLFRNDVSGKDFVRAFTEEFGRRGGVVVERDPFSEQINEFEPYARRLVKEKVPSVVVSGNAPEVRSIMRELAKAGGAPTVLATNGPAASDTGNFKGLRYVVLFSPDRPVSPEGAQFVSAFTTKASHAPDHWGALGYDAAMMIGLAVHEKGATRRAIREWFDAATSERRSHAGATGPIAFDGNRDPVNKQVLIGEVTR